MYECHCPERGGENTTQKFCRTECQLYENPSEEKPTKEIRTSDLNPVHTAEEVLLLLRSGQPGPWPNDWSKWSNVQEAHRRLFQGYAGDVEPYPEGTFQGRGIVICAGAKALPHRGLPNGGYMACVWVLVSKLRRMGCSLPVQLWHLGVSEMDPHLSRMLEAFGVECIDAKDVAAQVGMRILAGWEAKPFATKWSSFEEVLFIDADNAPINRDVGLLFEGKEYQETGSVFWPDYDHWTLHEGVWNIFGIPSPGNEPAFESGQFLINKRKCWNELCLALKYAEHSDYVFRHVYGDKEVFHLAWRQLGTAYSMPARGPGWEGDSAGGFCIVQHDFDGTQIFLHRCQDKWKYQGRNRTGSMMDENLHHQLCEHFSILWNGRIWDNPAPSEIEAKAMQKLAGEYEYRRLPKDQFKGDARRLQLLADGTIGAGKDKCETRWACHLINYKGKNQIVVAICSEHELTALLTVQSEGFLVGEWVDHERCDCTLSKMGDIPTPSPESVTHEVLALLRKRGYAEYGKAISLIIQQLEKANEHHGTEKPPE